MKEKIIKIIVSELNQRFDYNKKRRIGELNKLKTFVKNSSYFDGKKKKIYSIIIQAKKK